MSFRKYFVKRLGTALLALFIALTINFFIFRVFAPVKDPTEIIMIPDFPEAEKQRLRVLWGLDRPLFEQYLVYMYNLMTWQYGLTFQTQPKPIGPEMTWRLVNSLSILGISTVLSTGMGIALGVYAASKRGKKLDVLITSSGLFSWAVPTFFVQIVFILVFSHYLHILPSGGVVDPRVHVDSVDLFLDVAYHAVGPVISLTITGFGFWGMYTRNLMVDILTEDYIMTAHAKGVKGRTVMFGHAFRSILPQVATVMVTRFPTLVVGSVITEQLFSWPGIGQWMIEALYQGNHPVTQAITWNYMFLIVIGFLAMDVLYGFLDPRIRTGASR